MKIFLSKILFIVICFSAITLSSRASNIQEINEPFGNWLVSCKQNLLTAKNDCFIGSPFSNEHGRGAIVFTKFYLAVAHNELNLNEGIDFKVDNKSAISSYMNTGVSVFFKNADRKSLLSQMSKGKKLQIIIKGITTLKQPLDGFNDAYNFYIKKISE